MKYYLRENQFFNCYDSDHCLVEYIDWFEPEYVGNLKNRKEYAEETLENHIDDSGANQMVEIKESIYLKIKALYGSGF